MLRVIQPELLDSLPHDHPEARRSRRDLRWINAAMGNHRWVARTLARLLGPDARAIEIGAGTGELARRLNRAGIATDGLDHCPAPTDWPADRAWYRTDLLAFPHYGQYDALVASLVLHHFEDSALVRLGARLGPRVRVIIAAEPARSRRAQSLFRVLAPLFGANRVTRYDAHVSIAAGFAGEELPNVLGLDSEDWDVRVASGFPGGYRMIAVRKP